MAFPLGELVGVWAAVLGGTLVQAATPISLELPQDLHYNEYIAEQLNSAAFSSDPHHLLSIYQERAASGAAGPAQGPVLEAFIFNPNQCAQPGEAQSYRISVRNMGGVAAESISVQLQYPREMRVDSMEPAAEKDEDRSLLTWFAQDLAPGGFLTFSYTLTAEQAAQFYLNNLTVYYFDDEARPFLTLGERRLSGQCGVGDSIRNFLAGRNPVVPAIVCDPAEVGCQESYQTLDLGRNYFRALEPERQPIVCSQHDRELRQGLVPPCEDVTPQLGVKFAEAVADIIPGDCRVFEDERIVEPDLHDALSRRSRPAAPFLMPLYTSSQDFRRLVQENVLLGIAHRTVVSDRLSPIHSDTWASFIRTANERLQGTISTSAANGRLTSERASSLARITSAQPGLRSSYQTMQESRRNNFPAIICGGGSVSSACKAVQNARASIAAACDGRSDDGGLAGRLPSVQSTYNSRLSDRSSRYSQTQTDSLQAYTRDVDEHIRRLRDGFAALDAGNPAPLEQALHTVGTVQDTVLGNFLRPYRNHLISDESTDDQVRLEQFEPALDPSKEAATTCEKERRRPRG